MKSFDQAYFDKWYRHPAHRIGTRADLERHVRFAVSAAEYMLSRPIRSVLDVGAGEGRWQPVLQSVRPHARYVGVDPSEYTLQRFGASRNIVRGTFDDLDTLFGERTFDLVVCCSVLNYLPLPDARRALERLYAHTRGLAFIELFSVEDDVAGDTQEWYTETAATYRDVLREVGFTPCGMHCYVVGETARAAAALEKAPPES